MCKPTYLRVEITSDWLASKPYFPALHPGECFSNLQSLVRGCIDYVVDARCLVQDSVSPIAWLLSVMWRIYSASFLYTFIVNTRICFSSSDWWMATSTVQHTWVASSSPYPEELAQGQYSAGSITPPDMPTTVGSVVSSQLEYDQLGLLPWIIHIVQKESDVIPWVPSYPPLPTLLPCCLSILFFLLVVTTIYYTSFIHLYFL